jgi:benzoate transport
MANTTDPREIIDQSPMTTAQIVVVALTVLLNAMDGFDILSIAFASPGIMREWGINRAALGIVLSMELVGMAFGSVILGGVADKIGRRPTLMGCLVVMAAGMLGATTATSPLELSIWRVFTGLGIGGMLSATNAVVAEFSNKKNRSLSISLMVIGYPLGGGLGGFYASSIIEAYGWRSVFYIGATATAVLLPLIFFCIPESIHWLTRKQPANALAKINASLSRLGQSVVSALPTIHEDDRKKSVADIFAPALRGTTLLVTATYFLHIVSFYFLLKWAPQITSSMGFPDSAAGNVLAWSNMGGAAGGAIFGLLSARFGLKPLTIAILILNSLAIVAFGRTSADLTTLTMLAIVVGFFGNAAVSGLYSIASYAFPTHVRATGTGFVIGVGRGGAVISPNLAGNLMQANLGLPTVALIMAVGSLLAGIMLSMLNLGSAQPVLDKDKSRSLDASGARARA